MGEAKRPEFAATVIDPTGSREPSLAATLKSEPKLDAPDLVAVRGTTIGRYLVLDVLGAGGMGVVYTAYDPQLDRKVALKLVQHRAQDGDAERRARMLREAQAIARISHPNVVAVHDVGTLDNLVFIAMELVDGATLSAWLRQRDRSVAEILAVLVQAGRGLAAAHRSGLVHRDFKPDNVLIGSDGRARVVDFGLVRELDGASTFDTHVEPRVRPSEPMLATPLTRVGAVMGTPLYMAPEQMLDRATDARSDQYSFCVTLYEALAGVLPFHATKLEDLTAKVLAGNPPEIPAIRKVPAHVSAAIRRGMSVDPQARWPAMDTVLDEIARDPSARRRRALAIAGLVSAAGLAVTIPILATGGAKAASLCHEASAEITGAWGPVQRHALRSAFAATGAPYADAAFGSVARQLDAYARRWATSHEDSCRATHVRQDQSVELLDLRTACLQRRRTELATFVELMLAVDAAGVSRAHTAAAGLSPIDDCDDVATLQAPIKLPTNEPGRRAIAVAREELARIQALFQAGRFKDALVRVEALATQAHALAYRPLEAEVGQLLGQIRGRSGDSDGAANAAVAALAAATSSHHDEVALKAALSLVTAAANKQEFTRGHDWALLAAALVERIGNAPARRASVHHATGYLLSCEGKYTAAAEQHEQALALRQRIAPGSYDVARSLNSLAFAYDEIGRYADARRVGERSLAIQETELGLEHPEVATVLTNLGNIASDEGDLASASRYYQRSLAIRERTMLAGDDQALLASVINNLATVAYEQEHYDEALVHNRRALAIREQLPNGTPEVMMSLANIAATRYKQGKHAVALAGFQRALALGEKALGKDHPYVGDALLGLGECQWAARNFDASKAALERALEIRKLGARPSEVADVEFTLARTLWDRAPRDRVQRDRAMTLARSARTVFASSPSGRRKLAEVDAWLGAR